MVALRVIGETQKQIKCGNNQPVVVIAYERSWRLQQSRGDMALYNRTGVIWRFTTEQGRYGHYYGLSVDKTPRGPKREPPRL